ncbi:MAG: T9SS type A sorting domain-containing protein, partial [Chitinophagales bacterium]
DAPITCFAQVETASPNDADSTPGNDSNQTPNEDDEDDVTVSPTPAPLVDLELTKTASVSEATVGDQFTYTVTLDNKGPADATGVSVEVNPPAGLTFISSNPSMGSYSDATKTWTIGAVANGETKTLDIVVEVVSIDAPITCFAQVETASPDDIDSTPGNDSNQTPNEDDEDDVTVTPAIGGDGVDLELTKTVDNPLLVKYSHRTFTVTVINKGTETANNVTVKDVLPAGLAYTNHSTSKGTYSVWGGIWTIGSLAPNESVSFDLTLFILDDSAPITNFAQVQTASPDDIDSTPGNDTDNTPDEDDEDEATLSSDVIVTDNIDLELNKNANVVDAGVGEEIIYTLILSNNGTISATGVLVEDLLPSGLSYVSSNPSKGSYNNGSGIWNVGTVAVDETVTLTITTTVLTINESITNFAQVEAANEDDTDSTPGNDSNNTPNEDDEDNAIVYAPITCDNVTEAGSIGYAESECGPYDPDPIVSVELPSGGTGALEYLWFKSTIGTTFYTNSPDWTAVPNSNSASIDPVSITETTYYIRCSRRFGCYNYPGESNVIIKTVEDCGGNDTDIDLEVEVSVDSLNPSLFSNVTFTVTVTNNSTVTATGVELDIPIPAGMAYTNKILSQGNYNLWTKVWDVDLLAGGTSATLDLVLFVLNLDNPVTTFAQVIEADQTDMDSTPDNNNTTTPVEDDEAAATVSLAGSSGGKGSLADGPIDRATTLVLQDLFPIPTNDRLNILFETAGFQVNLFLYDVNGKMLSKRSLRVAKGDNAIQLETGHLPAGFYTISLHTPEGYVRGKFVKQ